MKRFVCNEWWKWKDIQQAVVHGMNYYYLLADGSFVNELDIFAFLAHFLKRKYAMFKAGYELDIIENKNLQIGIKSQEKYLKKRN